MFESKFDITKLMDKPIWQMCGEEFVLLTEFAFNRNLNPARQEPQTQFVYGISSLAEYLGCGNSTVYALKKEGVRGTFGNDSTYLTPITFIRWIEAYMVHETRRSAMDWVSREKERTSR